MIMKKMVFLGFGCIIFTLFAAFRAPGEESLDLMARAQADTVITANELVAMAPLGSVAEKEDHKQIASVENNELYKNMLTNSASSANFVSYTSFRLHPMAVSYVKNYQDDNELRLQKMKSTAMVQFRMIDNILSNYKLPKELKYLAVVESDLYSNAVSRVGAVGPWQLMLGTARQLGLKVNRYHDERKNLYKSTNAAAKYLRDLYGEFNDWLLVIAAYNVGSARVETAIRKSRSRNFWKLQNYLPAESRNHVKKFIATHYIMEGQAGITTTVTADIKAMKKNALTEAELANTILTPVSGRYSSVVIARALEMDPDQFNHFNPDFDKTVNVKGYDLRLPIDKTELFIEKKSDILNESVQALLNPTLNQDMTKYPEGIKIPAKAEKKIVRTVHKKIHRK